MLAAWCGEENSRAAMAAHVMTRCLDAYGCRWHLGHRRLACNWHLLHEVFMNIDYGTHLATLPAKQTLTHAHMTCTPM